MTLIDDIKRDREAGTPGRFVNHGKEGATSPIVIGSEKGTNRHRLFAVYLPYGTNGRERDANARRIARVPRMEAALLAAEELAVEVQENYIAAVHAYEATPTDRGGVYGAKGTARTLMHTRYGLMQAALAAFRKALEAAA